MPLFGGDESTSRDSRYLKGGTLEIDFAEKLSGLVKVDMVSQWQDHIDISCEGDVRYEVSEEEQVLSVKG